MGLITILRKYIVSPSENSKPVVCSKKTQILTRTEHPIILKLTKRAAS